MTHHGSPIASALRPHHWRPLRCFVAASALLLLGGAMVLPHTVELGDPERERPLQETRVAESALHPAAPAHLEGSIDRLHAGCVACWLQAQTLSLVVSRAAAAAATPHARALPFPLAAPASRFAIRLGPARASPAACPV